MGKESEIQGPQVSRKRRVFISWSGNISKKVALALHEWLPCVIQSVSPYMSDKDIAKGAHWPTAIQRILEESDCGIICVTPENAQSAWLHFEAGAIAKHLDVSRVCPLVIGLGKADLKTPLALYQAADTSEDDIRDLLRTVNTSCRPHNLEEEVLGMVFRQWWPGLKSKLDKIREEANRPEEGSCGEPQESVPRDKMEERLDEILLLLREQEYRREEVALGEQMAPTLFSNLPPGTYPYVSTDPHITYYGRHGPSYITFPAKESRNIFEEELAGEIGRIRNDIGCGVSPNLSVLKAMLETYMDYCKRNRQDLNSTLVEEADNYLKGKRGLK